MKDILIFTIFIFTLSFLLSGFEIKNELFTTTYHMGCGNEAGFQLIKKIKKDKL